MVCLPVTGRDADAPDNIVWTPHDCVRAYLRLYELERFLQ
jgi:hypothetical protein